ncbi:gamma-aminobutyric acid type B receptor subunit 2-like isoform X2 [Mercenaria mercenaria]|uniref:gamma-aminobutyric acid type B receptor subunit 2-like isoform X2 n=1 Tax=Mercenaria mercenaria TaxID=6596 RepID=UPI00234EE04D|nr:gamma-aminobutyric acid type B receptor subunit 2-like isoform X2 [Mercenaria mercenaria]
MIVKQTVARWFCILHYIFSVCESVDNEKGRIVIAGLFPLTDVPEGVIGRGVKPAVDLAVKMISDSTDLLPDHNLQILHSNTKCDMAVATKFFFDMVDSNKTMVMVFGDACSSVSGPIAEISKEWNVSLLSYADTDPALSDRKKYHNFYRTVPSDNDFNPARLALLRKFNWTNVGTIFQGVSKGTARYGHAHNHLISLLEKADVKIIKSTAFVSDPGPAIKTLKKTDTRIIIGNFDEKMARQVFCHAHQNRMFGPKYQWIILGGYAENWWSVDDPNVSCTAAELNHTIDGYISTDILPISSSRKKTESGLTPNNYMKRYNETNKGQYSKYNGYAFDGVWVIAKAVDKIIKKAQAKQNNTDIRIDGDMFRGDKISAALNDTNFRGVTGTVRFHGGDRIGSILFEQYQGDRMVKIAEYHKIRDKLTYKNAHKIIWRGKGPPIDRKLVRVEYQRVPKSIYFSICTLAGVGIVLAIFFLVTNIIFREHRYIKMSSPNLNNIIIVGCILTYLSVLLLGTDGGVVHILYLGHICTSRAWVLSVGFTLAFGAMFSKTWRVHSIFTDIKLHKKVIKDYKLILVVTILLVIDAAILVTWQILDPLQTSTKNLTTMVEGDLDIVPVVEYCKSKQMSIWLGLIYAYKGLLLVFGCFLAWETRQVSIPALNDSKYIGMSVYNVVIMCVCGAAVSVVINDQPTSSFVIISFFIIFSTTITLCLVFGPKLVELKRDPTGEERRIRAKLQKPKKQTSREEANYDLHKKNEDLQAENIKFRNIISEKMRVLHDLMEQLGEDTHEIYFAGKSPIHKKVVELRLADSSPSKFSTGSDADDGSLFSDISCGSASWTIGNSPANKFHYHANKSVTSACTDTSVIECVDDVSKHIRMSSLARTNRYDEDEDDDQGEDDVFGGVYCGPPKQRGSIVTNNIHKENGRANLITEVHPLVHDFPNKSYNTTDNDLSRPVLSTMKVGSDKGGKNDCSTALLS